MSSAKKTPAPARGTKLMLSVGLVNVPVKLGPFTRDKSVRGTMCCPEHLVPAKTGPKVCPEGHMVDDPVLAFEHEGRYVVGIDRAEHRSAKTGTLALKNVVELDQVDPAVYEKTYLVWPQDGGEVAHDLIATALRESGKALIGTTAITTSTKAVAIRWSAMTNTLVAHVLAYDEAIAWADAKLVSEAITARPAPEKTHLGMAEAVLETLDSDFELGDVEDEYSASLLATIEALAGGQPLPLVADEPEVAPVGDLMAALTASVEAASAPVSKKKATRPQAPKRPKPAPKKSARKPRAKAAA